MNKVKRGGEKDEIKRRGEKENMGHQEVCPTSLATHDEAALLN
jgi:hypothetical protein